MEYPNWMPLDEQNHGYLRDESRREGRAEYIAFPRNEAEVTACLRDCAAEHCRVTVQGGRTGLAAGAVPDGGRVINLSRMDCILGMSRAADGALLLDGAARAGTADAAAGIDDEEDGHRRLE